jgi:hypothetical protein
LGSGDWSKYQASQVPTVEQKFGSWMKAISDRASVRQLLLSDRKPFGLRLAQISGRAFFVTNMTVCPWLRRWRGKLNRTILRCFETGCVGWRRVVAVQNFSGTATTVIVPQERNAGEPR